ncbi:hypothetical protein J6590_094217 [Homalodisca vitripennis]|nr:hypothetical protein J6590_094217 [Homalodisca vitripennis]
MKTDARARFPWYGINSQNGTSDDTIAKIQAKRQMMQPLLPMPEDMLQEAWFLMGSYIIPLDSVTERCRNHSSFSFRKLPQKRIVGPQK